MLVPFEKTVYFDYFEEVKYSINAVSQITGISQYTLRNWEKRFSLVVPQRLDNGFREYSEADVALLKSISSLLNEGHKIGDLSVALLNNEALPAFTPSLEEPELQRQVDQLYSSLLTYQLDQAESVYSSLQGRYSAAKLFEAAIQPILIRLGVDWAEGQITIAQEHFATAFLRARLMTYLNFFVPTIEGKRRKVLCATLSGERHEGGLLLLAVQLKLRGWSVIYLGVDLPIAELPEVNAQTQPAVICLSFAQSDLLERSIPGLSALGLPICIGGRGAQMYSPAHELPDNLHLFRVGGQEAAELVEILIDSA